MEEAYNACLSVQSKSIVPLLVDQYPRENSSLHPVATKWALESNFIMIRRLVIVEGYSVPSHCLLIAH